MRMIGRPLSLFALGTCRMAYAFAADPVCIIAAVPHSTYALLMISCLAYAVDGLVMMRLMAHASSLPITCFDMSSMLCMPSTMSISPCATRLASYRMTSRHITSGASMLMMRPRCVT